MGGTDLDKHAARTIGCHAFPQMMKRAVKRLRPALFLAVLVVPTLTSAQQETLQTVSSRMDQSMQAHAAAGDFSGSVLVARNGHVLYQHAFGYANLEWKVPNDLQTRFEIGSMTKHFTALLVLQFVNEGRIKLDGHVSDYLPYYRKDTGNRVTISELLSHTSGYSQFHIFPQLPGRAGQPNEVQRQEFRSEVLQRQFGVRARNEVRLKQLGLLPARSGSRTDFR